VENHIFDTYNSNELYLIIQDEYGQEIENILIEKSNDSDIRFETGGTVLLAPNGQPSKLTPEQYKLVRTPEFKAWFGDWETDPENASQVVDENGEPRVVYRGVYENQRNISGFWLTKSKSYAENYGEVKEYFVNIKNPMPEELFDKTWAVDYEKYDGRLGGFHKIVVKTINQIKLADGTNTTFDPNNADIRFRDGGQINSSPFMEWFSQWYKGISNKMNILFSLPSVTAPFKEKNVVILDVFEKIDQNISAKPYLNEITKKADEYGVTIYLEPTPKHNHFQDNLEKKKKITKGYLIEYYEKFGFQLTPNKQFMKRLSKNNSDIRFENGGEIDSKVENAKAELLKAFPNLNKLDFLGKGRFGYSFLIDINYELYVVKYTTSLTEFWATQMAMVSNAPHVVKFLDAKELSEQFTYGIIHEYVNRDGMINEDVWNYALLKADGLSPRKQGLNIEEIKKKVPPKALEYEINLVTKLVNELKSFFGTDLDLLQQNWGYNSNGELVLFDLDGNIKKAQYLEWMEKYKTEPKMADGGNILPNTQKLIEELKKHSDHTTSEIMTNKEGEKYRFHHWKLKYKSASNYLVNLFQKASLENTGKNYNRNFSVGDISFYYDRPEMKNRPNGSMQMKELEVLETFAGGGNIDNITKIKSTEDLIQLVATARENKVKEWKRLGEKVVVGRNDGYWWELPNEREAMTYFARNPSKIKIQQIIKEYPNVTEIHFSGSIKSAERVGFEMEIIDDFDVTLWSKNNEFFKEGMTFEYSSDNGKYRNTIVNKNETEYKDREDKKKFVYFKSVDKYGNVGEARTNEEVLKEDFENGNAFFVDKKAGGGNIDINEPFYVNGKTLAERVRILLKQLYPDYKWSVTSSYNKLDVYLLEADFDPFSENWKEAYPTRELYYNVNNRDLRETNRADGNLTDRAIEVFKPIREYIDRFVYNRNADDPYADYSDYNIYEYTYIGKWDKPYKQVEPKAGKKKSKAPITQTVAPTTTPPKADYPFKVGDILALSTEELNSYNSNRAFSASQECYLIQEINQPFSTFIQFSFQNDQLTVSIETENIIKKYVKATAPLFNFGDMVVKKSAPNSPQKIKHRAYYQQIGVKYSTLEKRFLLSGMCWNYELEDGTYANEGELELYSATHSIASYTTPNDVFTIQNIVSKTQWSEGLKSSMTTDFIISGYEDVRLLIGANKQETSSAIQKKVDGFASEKNTYLQANMLAEEIHKLIDTGNVPFPTTSTQPEPKFKVGDIVRYVGGKDTYIVEKITYSQNFKQDLYNLLWQSGDPTSLKTPQAVAGDLELVSSGQPEPKFKVGDVVRYKGAIENLIVEDSIYRNNFKSYAYKVRWESDGVLTTETEDKLELVSTAQPTTENTFIDYLTANTEVANEITKELEVTSSLAMFVMGSKDIANLDSKKYAELMEELLKKFPKLIEDDSTNAN
jgi:hypothetical protein